MRFTRTSKLDLSGAHVLHDGVIQWKPGKRDYMDEIRLQWLQQIAARAKPLPFNVSVFTADTGWCAQPSGLQALTVESGASPEGAVAGSLLLPLEEKHWEQPYDAVHKANSQPWQDEFFAEDWIPMTCRWRGSKSGQAHVQHLTTLGRESCMHNQTDRACVVGKRLRGVRFTRPVAKGKKNRVVEIRGQFNIMDMFAKPGMRSTDEEIFEGGCVLAIDGNSYASIFGDALTRGLLVVRVGGYQRPASHHGHARSAASRVSFYQWFEPLLVSGVHYVRTSVDDLERTVARVYEMPSEEQWRIAKRAYKAASFLFSARGRQCYSTLAFSYMPRPYTCA